MQVEKYGYKWTKKESGYYQSTTNFPDGTRHWIHQEVFSREKGWLKAGYHIHHKDGDKDNNGPDNLEQIAGVEHAELHMSELNRLETVSERTRTNNAELQLLATAAKRGEYVGKSKLRKLLKGNKHRDCAYCGTPFVLKDTDKNTTKYCQTVCAQRASKASRIEGYTPLAESLTCPTCSTLFKPKAGNQICCSDVCRRVQATIKTKQDIITKQCFCGESYETFRTSKRKYCSDGCKKRSRASKD